MGELGELLRKAREGKGLSLAQVEEATRIRSAYLQALEEDAYERLPAPVYAKGFLKNYALYLGLDAQQLLGLYSVPEAPAGGAPTSVLLDEPLQPFQLRLRRWWPVGLVVLAIALAAAGWWAVQRYGDRIALHWPFGRLAATVVETATPTVAATPVPPTATLVPPTATPLPTQTPFVPTLTPTSTGVTGLELGVEVIGARSWLLVQADDEPVFAGILEPGAAQTWTARERIVIRCGYAGAVQLTLNGQPLGLCGEDGQVVDREWTVPGVPTRTPAPTSTP
jgi:transcriptional regulator with XRE-family HTH domain